MIFPFSEVLLLGSVENNLCVTVIIANKVWILNSKLKVTNVHSNMCRFYNMDDVCNFFLLSVNNFSTRSKTHAIFIIVWKYRRKSYRKSETIYGVYEFIGLYIFSIRSFPPEFSFRILRVSIASFLKNNFVDKFCRTICTRILKNTTY